MPKIEDLRKKIDEIDDELLGLLNSRAKLVIDIGRIKKEQNTVFHVPDREKQILERLAKKNKGPFPNGVPSGGAERDILRLAFA